MNSRTLIIISSVALLSVGLFFVITSKTEKNYFSSMAAERTSYKKFLAADSTLIPSGDTLGIRFFDLDTSYIVTAQVKILKRTDIIHIRTSDGENNKFIKHAKLIFNLKNKKHELILLKDEKSFNFFLPFSDQTSGVETYGAGRYLPVKFIDGEDMELDFNLAFNPKCAYNHIYICPIPPIENHLETKILAGEKTYVKNSASEPAIP